MLWIVEKVVCQISDKRKEANLRRRNQHLEKIKSWQEHWHIQQAQWSVECPVIVAYWIRTVVRSELIMPLDAIKNLGAIH